MASQPRDSAVAVDFPGFRRSGSELTAGEASVPRLSARLVRCPKRRENGPVMVAGHDIGGGSAQHLMLTGAVRVSRAAVVSGIMSDSWRAPGVARIRDPAVGRGDDAGRYSGRVASRREGPRTPRERDRDHGISRSVDRCEGRATLAGARRRGGQPLHSGAEAGPASIRDAEAPSMGRGRPVSVD
jgi:pimeloyl-ACP methyl ester carboxylesterase